MVPLLNDDTSYCIDEKASCINQRGIGGNCKTRSPILFFFSFLFFFSTLEFKVRRSRSIVNHRPAKLDTHGIPLIYSASYCASELNPLSGHPKKRLSLSLSLSRARARFWRSLYKFHESFEPYIFSLSSRFARHVLLKYDNFTRRSLSIPCLVFFLRLFAPLSLSLCVRSLKYSPLWWATQVKVNFSQFFRREWSDLGRFEMI